MGQSGSLFHTLFLYIFMVCVLYTGGLLYLEVIDTQN